MNDKDEPITEERIQQIVQQELQRAANVTETAKAGIGEQKERSASRQADMLEQEAMASSTPTPQLAILSPDRDYLNGGEKRQSTGTTIPELGTDKAIDGDFEPIAGTSNGEAMERNKGLLVN